MPAATPAAKVTAKNTRTGTVQSGWVCGGGSIPAFFSGLELNGNTILVMTQPEPKRFISDITVLTRDGQERGHPAGSKQAPLPRPLDALPIRL